ncbi:uncharacterized protein METZ01_LOCUS6579 [marine metagenome]|uniref:Uncharacterized protein n=1 Tax=marine metagenome TaxID=408172 RepID=A0A381NGL3_9ZZZZ
MSVVLLCADAGVHDVATSRAVKHPHRPRTRALGEQSGVLRVDAATVEAAM